MESTILPHYPGRPSDRCAHKAWHTPEETGNKREGRWAEGYLSACLLCGIPLSRTRFFCFVLNYIGTEFCGMLYKYKHLSYLSRLVSHMTCVRGNGKRGWIGDLPSFRSWRNKNWTTFGKLDRRRLGCWPGGASPSLTKVHALRGLQVHWFRLPGWCLRSEIHMLIWKIYCGIHSRAVWKEGICHI